MNIICHSYIDDILIYLKSDEEHVGYLSIVLQTLKKNELYNVSSG